MPLVPRRRNEQEILDGTDVPAALRERSHRDIALANTLFGGTRALLSALAESLESIPPNASFLDIGSGTGETADAVARFGASRGVQLRTFALDVDPSLAARAAQYADHAVCGSAMQLPFADHSIDVVACHQVAHHFAGDALASLLREMQRVARHRVIVSDLRRSWLAAAGLLAASFPLGFHPVSRHDGVLSILRGFTGPELQSLVYESCGVHPAVSRRAAFRLVASWSPAHAPVPEPAMLPHA